MPPAHPTDFVWSSVPEPHLQRKKEILTKYGRQVNALMGHEPLTKYITLALVAIQLTLAVVAPQLTWWQYFLVGYFIAGTITHALFLAIHEITHNMAFKKPWANDLLAIVANFPVVVPYAMAFKTYHAEHHRYMGWDGVDTDIPTQWEAANFDTKAGRTFFVLFEVFFYALRPPFVRPQSFTPMVALNLVAQITFLVTFYTLFGAAPIRFLLMSNLLAAALHPVAGHFISEHYVFDTSGRQQETNSYYGPLNNVAWNVGYHNEHHDFPNVPWSRLKQLKALAPEYYECLYACPSWPGALWKFIWSPTMSLYSRVKRERGAGQRSNLMPTGQ